MPSNRARFLVALFAALCLLAFAAACGDSDDDAEDSAGDSAEEAEVALTPYQPKGNEGSIVGTVSFSGPAPAPRPISMDQDPVCAQTGSGAVAEDIVVNADKLQNVFGIQTKQTLNVTNSDATSHNVNVDAKLNGKFNQGQPNGAPPITKQFA